MSNPDDGPLCAALPTASPGLSHPFATAAAPHSDSIGVDPSRDPVKPATDGSGKDRAQPASTAAVSKPAKAASPAISSGSSTLGHAAAGIWAAAIVGGVVLLLVA